MALMGSRMADYTSFSTIYTVCFWLAIAALWGYISSRILAENGFSREKTPALPTIQYLAARLQDLQRRNVQLWALVSLLLVANAVSSIVTGFNSAPAPRPVVETVAENPIKQPPQQTEEPAKSVAVPDTATGSDENLSSNHPVPATNSLPFSDITEFNEKDSKQQAYLDWLKQRYENWLVTYYYLHKCNMAGKDDFEFIRKSLSKELAGLNTEVASVEDNILLAANGSYNELYAAASCDDERMVVTKTSYDTYMQQVQTTGVKPEENNAPKAKTP